MSIDVSKANLILESATPNDRLSFSKANLIMATGPDLFAISKANLILITGLPDAGSRRMSLM